MKAISKPTKKKILVALLGMCVVSSSYSPALASQSQTAAAVVQSGSARSADPQSPAGTTTALVQSGQTMSPKGLWWWSPFWPFFYYYYCYCPYYYYYYNGVVVVIP